MGATTERNITGETTVGAVVADDFRAAKVFEKHGIDFCCGGNIPLADICREKGLDQAALLRELAALKDTPAERGQNYDAWTLPFLADYIINTHHSYLYESIPQIAAYTEKIAEVHGRNHPEVVEIAAIFTRLATDMAAHLREEEEVLFPAVRRIEARRRDKAPPEAADVAIIRESLAKLDREHQEVGDAVHEIHRLAGGYAVPEDACTTYRLTYRMLQEFEDDLHKHVHLENNILFPKAARS